MMGLMPQERRPVIKEKSATSVMACRGVLGTRASLCMPRWTRGVEATT